MSIDLINMNDVTTPIPRVHASQEVMREALASGTAPVTSMVSMVNGAASALAGKNADRARFPLANKGEIA